MTGMAEQTADQPAKRTIFTVLEWAACGVMVLVIAVLLLACWAPAILGAPSTQTDDQPRQRSHPGMRFRQAAPQRP